jgi:uncharacterized membrane-anchored protein YhcB (DUF1043 family)
MNEIIGFAAVIVSIFVGMLFNSSRFNAIDARFSAIDARLDRMQGELNGRMDRMQGELNGRMDRMQADLSQFYRDLGRHDAKIESIEKKAS